jgi:hypothetical protein
MATSFKTNPKPAKGSHRLARNERRAAADKAMADAYEQVNQRDGNICRVTGRHLSAGAVDGRVRREHHHLVPRSIAPDRETDPTNIVLVCAEAHDLLTGHFLESEGKNANRPVFFHWNEQAMKGRIKPFRIVGKRTAA